MKMLRSIAAFLSAGLVSANAQTALQPPNSRGLNGLDTVNMSPVGALAYGVWPVIIGANGLLYATATSQLSCPSGGDATVKIVAGTGANPANGVTFEATIVSSSMSVVAFAQGQGNGTRWAIQPNQRVVDNNSGTVVNQNVFINAQTFIGGYTVIFLNPNNTDPPPTVGNVINLVFNNPGLPGNPVTVSYTVVAGDTDYNALTIHLTSAINANSTLAAAKIGAWSSPPPYTIQMSQLAGTPASTTISYTQGTNTETMGFGLNAPGTPSPGSLDTSAGGAGVYSLTGTQPDVNGAYPYFEMFTVVPVPGSGIVSLSPEVTVTNCNPFNITTVAGVATGLTPGATYWLNVSLRTITGKSLGWTNNFFTYATY